MNQGPTISIHEHELKDTVNVEEYQRDVAQAIKDLKVPGLLYAYFLKGFKGERNNKHAIVWVWENQEVIKENFGTLDNPKWPKDWLHYENEVLAKYLTCHPDKINFTCYNVIDAVHY